MKTDGCPVKKEIGSCHASDPPGPGDRSVFWKPKPGETPKVRLILPDNVAACVDNSGIEEQFDEGIEYIYETGTAGMISVHDRTGVIRECFASRFDVKSSKDMFIFRKHFKPKGEK